MKPTERLAWVSTRMASRRALAWLFVICTVTLSLHMFGYKSQEFKLTLETNSTVALPRSVSRKVPSADSNLRQPVEVQSAVNETKEFGSKPFVLEPTDHSTTGTDLPNTATTTKNVEETSHPSETTWPTTGQLDDPHRHDRHGPVYLPLLPWEQSSITCWNVTN
jgi:hypothetical protein